MNEMYLVLTSKLWNYEAHYRVVLLEMGYFKSKIKLKGKHYEVCNQKLFMTQKDAQEYIARRLKWIEFLKED